MVVVCYLATIPFSVHAQPKFTDDLKIGANGHFGVVLPEYPFYNYVVQDYVHSLDLNVVKESSGKNVWEDLYNYPEHGPWNQRPFTLQWMLRYSTFLK